MQDLNKKAEILLKKLISIKSFSFKEDKTADYLENWFKENDIKHIDQSIMFMLTIRIFKKTNLPYC